MSRKLSTNNNISSRKEGFFPAAFHGLCLLLFSGTVPDLVTPLFPLRLQNTPRFSRLPSLHSPAFPPPANIQIFYLVPCSVFSCRLPWQAHTRKRKPVLWLWCSEPRHTPAPPSLLGEPGPAHTSHSESTGHQHRFTTSAFPQMPTASQSYGGILRGMKEDTAQHSICSSTFQTLARAWRCSSSPTSYKLLNYSFISYGSTSQGSPKENPPQDTNPVCGCQDPLLWQQKDIGVAGYLMEGRQGISWSKEQALICSCQHRTMCWRSQQPSSGRAELWFPSSPLELHPCPHGWGVTLQWS